ncbi:MAG TPA: phosphoribosyltransferase family protein [Acidimicrobiales bacterium]|nr:phosphoribosyltransferase family protein [Acidimicrobiales bacterium]
MTVAPTAPLSAGEIASLVDRLASEIGADHPDGVTVVGVLKGSVFLVADLVRALSVPCTVDFLSLSAYTPGERRVRILKDLDRDVSGEDVVIAADIVDTGLSIRYAVDLVQARGARNVRVCALLDRPARRILPVPLEYRGAEVGEDFLVGYGLDYAERYRNLASIIPVDPDQLKADPQSFEGLVFGSQGAVSDRKARD